MSLEPEHLAKINVFGELNHAERKELVQLAHRRTASKNEILCYQEDLWPFAIYIAHGQLRSSIASPDGRNYIVSAWETGDVFWAHTIFDQLPMPSTLEAARVSTLYQWDGEQALEIVLRNPAAARALMGYQTSLIRKRRENIYSLVFNPVVSRLAKLIAGKFDTDENPTMQRDLTLDEMAGMVATSPVVVCRLLYQLQTEGILTVKRASITLNNRNALMRLVEQEKNESD